MIPFEILSELFAIATEPYCRIPWSLGSPPTAESVAHIQKTLGITLPDDYVRIATACPTYGGWLAGIGEDYDSGYHILRLNASFRVPDVFPALAEHYVMVDHGHDGDCDCWDMRESMPSGEHPIVYVGLDGVRPCRVARFETFRAYIESFVLTAARDNPTSKLRRRAKRLIQELQHDHAA